MHASETTSKVEQFENIRKTYADFEQQLLSQGKLPMRSTEAGFWGASRLNVVFDFFREIQLDKLKSFLDLGSGDGRVALVASLFTKASGADLDLELVDKSIEIRDSLKLHADFLCQDFLSLDFSKHDFFFINPDHTFSNLLEDKLLREAKGKVLFVYNVVYAPEKLKKGRTYWYDQTPIIKYDIIEK